MPATGQPSTQPCPKCGRPMEWRTDAIRRHKVRGTGAGFAQEEGSEEAAYVCAFGHASDKCARCGSRDTIRADASTVQCHACGQRTPVTDEQ